MFHGSIDPTVKIYLGRDSRRRMEDVGFEPEWIELRAVHEITSEMAENLEAFLDKVIPEQ
jgi:predicted esterase